MANNVLLHLIIIHHQSSSIIARRVCPALTIIPPDLLLLARGTRLLCELSAEFSPVVEPAVGRVFLDLTGTGRLFGPARDVASRNRIRGQTE